MSLWDSALDLLVSGSGGGSGGGSLGSMGSAGSMDLSANNSTTSPMDLDDLLRDYESIMSNFHMMHDGGQSAAGGGGGDNASSLDGEMGGMGGVGGPAAGEFGYRRTSMFKFVAQGVLLTAVSLFGLVGNTIAIVVLSRPAMRGSFSTLLIGLSSFDLLYLTIGIAIFGLPALSANYLRHVYVHIMPVGFGFGHIGRVGSVFVTMSVTVERYFAIVHPLKHFWQKKFLLLASLIVAVLYNIPKFFELEKKVRFLNGTSILVVSGTDLRSNPQYVTYYIFWSKFIFVEVIPYFTILILNSLIIGKIWKSNQFRKRFLDSDLDPEATSRQRREANLGLVLISISVLFILCQSVKIVPDLYEGLFCRLGSSGSVVEAAENGSSRARSRARSLVGGDLIGLDGLLDSVCPSTSLMDHLIDLSHLLLAINSSANFILYTWRGEKFREILARTFHLQRCLPPSSRRRHRPSSLGGGHSLANTGGGGGHNCCGGGGGSVNNRQLDVTEMLTTLTTPTSCRAIVNGNGNKSNHFNRLSTAVSVYDLREKRSNSLSTPTIFRRMETSV